MTMNKEALRTFENKETVYWSSTIFCLSVQRYYASIFQSKKISGKCHEINLVFCEVS